MKTILTIQKAVVHSILAVGLALPVRGAEPMAFQLANGLRVRLVPEQEQDKAVVILGTRAGILNEPKGKPHVAHVVEHATVFDLKNPELAATTRQWFSRGKVNGETLGELMYFDMHMSREELPLALAMQAARLGNVTYSEATRERETPRTLKEIETVLGRPDALGKFALLPFVQGALYGATTVPFRRQTRQLAVGDLREFHADHFRTDSSLLCVIGDFDPAKARQEIEKLFGSIPRPAQPPVPRPAVAPGFQRVTWDVPRRYFFLAWAVPSPDHADQPALFLAGMLLQQRLFELHQAGTLNRLPVVHYDLDGIFLIGCEVADEASFAPARKSILAEVGKLIQPTFVLDEAFRTAVQGLEQLQKTDLLLAQPLPAGVSRTMALANLELQRMRHELVLGDFDQYVARLHRLEPSAARKVIANRLTPQAVLAMRIAPTPEFDN